MEQIGNGWRDLREPTENGKALMLVPPAPGFHTVRIITELGDKMKEAIMHAVCAQHHPSAPNIFTPLLKSRFFVSGAKTRFGQGGVREEQA